MESLVSSKHKKILWVVFSVVFLIILLAFALVMFRNGIFASEIENRGKIIDQLRTEADLDKDGKSEKILATVYEGSKKDYNSFYLDVKKSLFENYSSVLSGFEKEISFCPEVITSKDGFPNLFCITGYVGAHSQNTQLFSLQNEQLITIKFSRDTELSNSISSDLPNFSFNLESNSGKLEFYIDNRNYNKNPLVDIKRNYYYFNNNLMIFDREQDMEYNGTSFENVGQIN